MDARVLVVDDHASFRSIARRVLAADGFLVVGEASDGAEAIRASDDLRPDIVLLDVQLPDIDGFAVAAALAAQVDPPAVVLVSSRSRADYGSRIEDCGARGFIAKSELSGHAMRRLLPDPERARAGMRVMVADDAVLFREGLSRVLADAGFEVTAQVGDAQALLNRVREDPPDVCVVDIRMPPTHTTEGLDAARVLGASHPGVGILVLSAHVEPHYALTLIENGAQGAGYLLKERVSDLAELADAVRRVAAGSLVGGARARDPLDALTDREREVLTVMAQGRSNQAICERLHLSPKTVEAYVRGVFTKLGLHQGADDNRRVLAVLAFLRG
jgi:DNA-binding NarL/FixJ family response regulator